MQSVSFRIWTWVGMFISYDDNDYTTGTSKPGNDGVLCISQSSSNWKLTITWFSVISRTHIAGVLLFCRGTVGIFYSPSRMGNERGIQTHTHIYIYIYIHIHTHIQQILPIRGALSETVTTIASVIKDPSSNPGQSSSLSFYSNALRKGMNLSFLPHLWINNRIDWILLSV